MTALLTSDGNQVKIESQLPKCNLLKKYCKYLTTKTIILINKNKVKKYIFPLETKKGMYHFLQINLNKGFVGS